MATKSDFTPIVVAYVCATAAAIAGLWLLPLPAPWDALWADVLATVVIFAFSVRYKNSSFYDPYWSVIPPLLWLYWLLLANPDINMERMFLVGGLVWLWAIRLTTNWSVYWGGLHHEDWRYPIVRARAGNWPKTVDFLGIHLFPTIQVFLGCLPIYAVSQYGTAPLGILDAVAALITLAAIAIETVADLQLHAFIAQRQPGTFIQSGLWKYSRHPNYFGELSFWWGLMVFGLAVAPQYGWWIALGAIAMTIMFAWVSVPFMDKRSVERRPAYAQYMQKVSALVLWPPRN